MAAEERELLEIHIDAPDEAIRAQVQKRIDQIAKPLDSLGKFETYLAQIGAVTGTADIDIRKKAVLVMCADNGIVEEGVSQCGQEVTRQVAESMGRGTSNVCKMAKVVGAEVIPVDVGIAEIATAEAEDADIPGILNRKVTPGTKNFRKEPAMTSEQVLAAIRVGMNLAAECEEKGYQILATGEMGIGNTTTAAAVTAALTGTSAERIVGRGAGLSDAGLARKRTVVQEALEKYGLTTSVPASFGRTMQILSWVGGLDIAAMAGVFIGGARVHLPVVIDGVISAVAALAAENLVPGVKAYMIPSHKSKEPAADVVFQALGMEPVIQGELALGEGTGAVMLFGLLDMAMSLYEKPTTFEDIAVEQYQRFVSFRKEEEMRIRTASVDDIDAIAGVEAECFPITEAATRAEFEDRLRFYSDHFLLMFDKGKLVAFIDGFVTDERDLTDEMYERADLHNEAGAWQMIFGVNTIPSYRKKGLAGELINRFIRSAKEQGRKGVVLTCKDALVNYYTQFGFENEGVSEKSAHGGVSWNQMRLTF